jgi:hypothetical protein
MSLRCLGSSLMYALTSADVCHSSPAALLVFPASANPAASRLQIGLQNPSLTWYFRPVLGSSWADGDGMTRHPPQPYEGLDGARSSILDPEVPAGGVELSPGRVYGRSGPVLLPAGGRRWNIVFSAIESGRY